MMRSRNCCWLPNRATGNRQCPICFGTSSSLVEIRECETGELYRIRTENLDWSNRIIFVPDSKTPEGRRMIPISDRVYQLLRIRTVGKEQGWLFPSTRSE